MAKIEDKKNKTLRTQIVDTVIERLQGTTKGSLLGKTYAESRFSRHVEQKELLHLMKTEEEEVRRKELNTIAEIVTQRIQDKLRGLEFYNPNMKMEQEEEARSLVCSLGPSSKF